MVILFFRLTAPSIDQFVTISSKFIHDKVLTAPSIDQFVEFPLVYSW